MRTNFIFLSPWTWTTGEWTNIILLTVVLSSLLWRPSSATECTKKKYYVNLFGVPLNATIQCPMTFQWTVSEYCCYGKYDRFDSDPFCCYSDTYKLVLAVGIICLLLLGSSCVIFICWAYNLPHHILYLLSCGHFNLNNWMRRNMINGPYVDPSFYSGEPFWSRAASEIQPYPLRPMPPRIFYPAAPANIKFRWDSMAASGQMPLFIVASRQFTRNPYSVKIDSRSHSSGFHGSSTGQFATDASNIVDLTVSDEESEADVIDIDELFKTKENDSLWIKHMRGSFQRGIPVRSGTDVSLCEIAEEFITLKNNCLSRKALAILIRDKYPDVAAKHKDLPGTLRDLYLRRPWMVDLGTNVEGRSHLWSIDEERKGFPLMTREANVPPIIFEIIKKSAEFGILDNDSKLSWYFFELDENGKEITEEKTTDKNRLIHVRLTTTPARPSERSVSSILSTGPDSRRSSLATLHESNHNKLLPLLDFHINIDEMEAAAELLEALKRIEDKGDKSLAITAIPQDIIPEESLTYEEEDVIELERAENDEISLIERARKVQILDEPTPQEFLKDIEDEFGTEVTIGVTPLTLDVDQTMKGDDPTKAVTSDSQKSTAGSGNSEESSHADQLLKTRPSTSYSLGDDMPKEIQRVDMPYTCPKLPGTIPEIDD